VKVLIVCTGNTCRSPLAAALLTHILARREARDVLVSSAGTGAWQGAPASEGAYLVGLEHGLDLSAHRARQLTGQLVADADLILTMSRSHRQRAIDMGAGDRVHVLGEYSGLPGTDAEVPDPYGGELAEYRATYERLERLLAAVADRLERERAGGDR
jgi:protein-tyrosine-phosphatase